MSKRDHSRLSCATFCRQLLKPPRMFGFICAFALFGIKLHDHLGHLAACMRAAETFKFFPIKRKSPLHGGGWPPPRRRTLNKHGFSGGPFYAVCDKLIREIR